MPKEKYYYYSHHHTSSYKKRRVRKIKMIIGGLFILLLTTGTIYFKILPLFFVKQSSNTLPASEEIFKSVVAEVVEEEEKGLDMLAQEISPKENTEEEKEEEKGITIDGCLKAGDTLYESLIKEGISAAEIINLQEKVKSVVDFNYLPVGSEYSLKYNPEGKVTEFIYKPNPIDIYCIDIPTSDSEDLKVTKEEICTEVVQLEGKIEYSLYESMMECADSPQLALQLAEIFAWQIDFLTECREGDTFNILVEKQYRGDFYRWGKVLTAQYKGELLSKHTAILFKDPSGHTDYYTEEGDSLRKAFLRAPLHYKYISSYFSKNRLHPILRIWRPHLAIDYAAPTGTPISTIGDGTVIYVGWNGGYGNYIKVRHPNNYVSAYGHLSRFAKGLKKGQRVEQGEIIGYVGATGLATGPHLDFSISKNGERVDFLKLKLPAASSVDPKYSAQFNEVKDKLLSDLKNVRELDLNMGLNDQQSTNLEGK
ncbi:MAG: peptidoglycan DD-metalloendopeptidase family protein [Candidatus Caldatribacteriota bacterium]|nr:peptidoglycan DD-metalloendopeptidase family protein [Candidatus Caldatribacteriota bacterium]